MSWIAPQKKAPSSHSSGKFSFFPSKKKPEPEVPKRTEKNSFLPQDGFKSSTDNQSIRVESSRPAPPQYSLDSLSSAQTAALSTMPAPVAATLREVWDTIGNHPPTQNQFLQLLENGKLSQSDGEKTVVERLHSVGHVQNSNLSGTFLTQQTVSLLASPELMVNQGDYSTCGAANLQYQLASSPSLLTKAVADLMGPEGETALPSGAKLERVDGSAHQDPSGRDLLNRVFQNAFMNAAGESRGLYNPATDQFSDGSKGLKALEIAKEVANLENRAQAVVIHDGETSKIVHKLFKSLPADQKVHLGVLWEDQDHMLLHLRSKDGEATYFDPQQRGVGTMPVDRLLFKTQFAILPAEHVKAEADNLPDDALYLVEADKN